MWEWQIDKNKERVRSRGHCLVFVSVSSSVPLVRCTGLVKPADDVHKVSGCTVPPMAFFYIVVFQIFLKSSQ